MYINNLKYLFQPLPIEIDTKQNILDRIYITYTALLEILSEEEPANINAQYSWLKEPQTGLFLSIDIFYSKITTLAEIPLANATCLAVETVSSLCKGPWDSSKEKYFSCEYDYNHYSDMLKWKRRELFARKIPFIEIDPDTDDISPYLLRRRVGALLDVML